MVLSIFEDVFNPKYFASNFLQLHQLNSHVTMGHFPRSIIRILGAVRLWPWPRFQVASYPLQWARSSIGWSAWPLCF